MNLCNVVVYDGVDSWVVKFVLKEKTAKRDILKYYEYSDAQVLKIDNLYPFTLEELIAYKISDDPAQVDIFNRFIKIYNECFI